MAAVIDDCKVFWVIVLVAEVRQLLVKCGLPTFRRDLVELGLKVEFPLE